MLGQVQYLYFTYPYSVLYQDVLGQVQYLYITYHYSVSDSCGEASPRVGVGNGEFDLLPAGNGAGNGESTVRVFHTKSIGK